MRIKCCLEIEVDCEFDFTPGTPARVSGPPEQCHEGEEADVELTAAVYNGQQLKLTPEHITELEEQILERESEFPN